LGSPVRAIVRLLTHTFGNAPYWATPHALGVLPRHETEAERRRSHEEKSVDICTCAHPAGWGGPLLGRFCSGPEHHRRLLSFRGWNLARGRRDRCSFVPPGGDYLRLSLEPWAGPLRVTGTHAECASGFCRKWQLRHQRDVCHRPNHLGQRRGHNGSVQGDCERDRPGSRF